jgi:nucleoid DNA-binding protein
MHMMNKERVAEFFANVTTYSGVGDPRTVKQVYYGIIKEISAELLRGNVAELPEFGEFWIKIKKEHVGKNVGTEEDVLKPESAILRFKPCRMMKIWCQNAKDRFKIM